MRLSCFPVPTPSLGVLILPGGGYGTLATGHEGRDVAAWLNARGIEAWMLEYSVAQSAPTPLGSRPIEEGRAAIEQIRSHNPTLKLGVWGFSAGGHLASMLATDEDCALDFAILAYPVISTRVGWTHEDSRRNLIGDVDAPELAIENRVSPRTPPTFMFHTADDAAVSVEGAFMFAYLLAKHRVPFELHIHESSRHGVGLAPDDADLRDWPLALERWLKRRV